ncbi:MAG: prepilin-type N-terminal cleavage/methylation domain-containing protein [Phycisphaerae bacterium]|jgi:prepilin-type N-terminal cleavage/methylation domain-containing protein/prepilin-type processing-associated H-X9-DG protein
MLKKKAFTLVELLVVISIIALLLAVLMPSLSKARKQGQRTVCLTRLKTLQLSNNVYANENDGLYVPLLTTSSATGPVSQNQVNPYTWVANLEFRKITGVKGKENSSVTYNNSIVLPDEFFCPSDEIAKKHLKSDKNVLVSYGYNSEDWWGMKANPQNSFPVSIPKGTSYGYRQTQIKAASQTLIFVDSIDWWVIWIGANYSQAWDRIGQRQREVYANPGSYGITGAVSTVGPVIFRHDEGANVAFYDGHSKYLKKNVMFINGNPGTPMRAWWDATGMWINKQ